jgi:hypothetical protein
VYKQAPYQEITKEEYDTFVASFPVIDWGNLKEEEDTTTGTQELSCTAGACEIVGVQT